MRSRRPRSRSEVELSRRAILARLGWGGAAISMLGAGPLPDWGELRLPGLQGPRPARGDEIKLSANENPYGMCAMARERMRAEAANVNRYPVRWESELVAELARAHGVAEEQLVLGAGSTEVLRMSAAAWIDAEHGLLQGDPTFETLGAYARGAGNRVVSVPVDAEGRHDLQRMVDAIDDQVGVVYVCNPSNPTSTLLPQAEFDAFLDALPERLIVLVDEAYHHFVQAPDYRSQMPRARNTPNVIVIRTFSKVFGMAGLRVGYAVGHPDRMRELERVRTEMSVSVLGASCAAESLHDSDYVPSQRRLNAQARQVLLDGLEGMGLSVWKSQTNFVMVDLGRPMMPVNQAMAQRGILVGRLFPALPNHLRISMGTAEQMQRCVDVLGEVLSDPSVSRTL